MEFYKCEVCGNIVVKVVEGAGTLSCCGQDMTVLKPGTTDGAAEKHVPALHLEGNTLQVQIGEVVHPMMPEHYIQLILAVQGNDVQYHKLTPDMEPKAEFIIDPSKPVTVYEYCNIHGLWMAGQK